MVANAPLARRLFEPGEIGPDLFRAACRMGLEGIVSKRTDAPTGPSRTWLKSKNPESAAVRREREEEWR